MGDDLEKFTEKPKGHGAVYARGVKRAEFVRPER